MLGGALVLHAVSFGLGESTAAVRWTLEAVAALGFLSVASSALAFLAYFHLLDRLGPVEINLVSYVAPVFAALVGWLALGEAVGVTTAVGFACIVAGFVALKRRAIAEEAPWLRRAARGASGGLRRWLP
jgi:drug/metabolite transporter (DMT)-like permease